MLDRIYDKLETIAEEPTLLSTVTLSAGHLYDRLPLDAAAAGEGAGGGIAALAVDTSESGAAPGAVPEVPMFALPKQLQKLYSAVKDLSESAHEVSVRKYTVLSRLSDQFAEEAVRLVKTVVRLVQLVALHSLAFFPLPHISDALVC